MSGFLDTLLKAILDYTGLSSKIVLSIAAVLVVASHVVSSLSPRRTDPFGEPLEQTPPPPQLGTISEDELAAYDGTDPEKPLLIAIKGNIYDVSTATGYYGPGYAYSLYTGMDASRAWAKTSHETQDLTGDISGLSADELSALDDWEKQFQSKYHKVGELPKPAAVAPDEQLPEVEEEGKVEE